MSGKARQAPPAAKGPEALGTHHGLGRITNLQSRSHDLGAGTGEANKTIMTATCFARFAKLIACGAKKAVSSRRSPIQPRAMMGFFRPPGPKPAEHCLPSLLSALLVAIMLAWTPAYAVEPNERLADPVLEGRARELSKGLRCLVCQNESIDESHAELAHDVRVMLRERLTAGDTDAQAVNYIVARYGNFVLLQPPVKPSTYVLWFGPPVLLGLAAVGAAFAFRRRPQAGGPTPLDDEEKQRLERLLRENEV